MAISTKRYDRQLILDTVSETDKNKAPYLIGNIDYWISHLVVNKPELRVAYDYYHGIRDKEEFKFLEDNYGVGNAFDLKFIPLVRKHIEVLKGQFLQNPLKYFITCSDTKSIGDIEQQRWEEFLGDFYRKTEDQIRTNLEYLRRRQQEGVKVPPPSNVLSEESLKELWDYYNIHWKSAFEISAQNVLDYLLQSRTLDFKTKLTDMFEHFLISGSAYYRARLDNIGEDPDIEVINPLHFFYNKNTNDRYIKQCTAGVYRFYRTPEELVNQFGHLMDEDEVEHLFKSKSAYGIDIYNSYYRNLLEEVASFRDRDRYNNYYNYSTSNVIECYHVEWVANNIVEYDDYDDMYKNSKGEYVPRKKHRYRLDRYSGYKLGDRIYVDMGKDENVIRPTDKPWKCYLSYNGISNTDINGIPYSLMLQTKDLQDRYDIYYMLRDNTVHNAGNKGLFMDTSMIPIEYGDTPEERQLTFLTMLKQGVAAINSAQEGVNPAMNTITTSFDLTLDHQTVQAYNLLIEIIENTVSSITGVTRQMLANIEERDAVQNVQTGIKQSLLVTKPMFHLMDNMVRESLVDMLNLAKKSYKYGKKGSILLNGAKRKAFTILPENFCFTDYDVHIVDADDQAIKLETARQFTLELIKAQQVSMDVAYRVIQSNSMTEISEIAKQEVVKQRAQQLSEAMQQVNDLSAKLEEVVKENKMLTNKDIENKRQELALKEQDIFKKYDLMEKQLLQDKEKADKDVALKQKQIEAEVAELFDSSKTNDEIRNIGQ